MTAYEDDNQDYLQIAEVLGIKRTTAWAIVQRYLRDGAVVRPRGGRRDAVQKVDDEMTDTLVEIVGLFPAFTLRQINTELQTRLPNKPRIGLSTVCKVLDAQLITTKKLEDAPAERNSDATKTSRYEYAQWMLQYGVNRNLVFVDEAGFNLYTRRTRGRAARGQRAVRQAAGNRGRNLNIIMAISPAIGVVYHEQHHGSVNADIFQVFLDNLGIVIGDEFEVDVVMDNAPVHRNCEMVNPHHRVHKLPPYSPMLNPIEFAFSSLKAGVKRLLAERMNAIIDRAAAAAAGQTLTAYRMEHLQRCVTIVVEDDEIDDVKCTNWHRHTLRYMPACLAMDDILM